jgi:hypothetical protein
MRAFEVAAPVTSLGIAFLDLWCECRELLDKLLAAAVLAASACLACGTLKEFTNLAALAAFVLINRHNRPKQKQGRQDLERRTGRQDNSRSIRRSQR